MSAPIFDAAATLQSAREAILAADHEESAVRAAGHLDAAAKLVELAKVEALIEIARQQRAANLLAYGSFRHVSPDGATLTVLFQAAVNAFDEAGQLLGVPVVTP